MGVPLLLLCLGLLLFRTPDIASRFFSNMGMIDLNNAIAGAVLGADQPTHAEQNLQTAVRYSPANATALRALGYLYEAQGQEDEARALWRSAGTGMAMELIDRGHMAHADDRPSDAEIWFERAADADPQLGDPWFHLGMTLEEQGDWAGAAASYEEGLRRSSKLKQIGLSNYYLHLGQLQDKLGVEQPWVSALAMYDRALEIGDFTDDWSRTQAIFRRGEALDILGRKEEAAAEFAAVISEIPEDEWAYIKLGRLLWEMDQDQVGAEKLYRAALDINDKNKWIYRGLGQMYQDSGREAEAAEMFKYVLSLDPDDDFARQQLDKLAASGAAVGD